MRWQMGRPSPKPRGGMGVLPAVHKAVEQMGQRVAVHAPAGVRHGDLDKSPLRFHAHADTATLGRKFKRVGEEIQQQLADGLGVEGDDAAVAVGEEVELHAALRKKEVHLGAHAAADADNVVIVELEALALKQVPRVGQIADDAVELVIALVKCRGGAVSLRVLLPRLLRCHAVDRRVDRRKRGAQLQCNIRQHIRQHFQFFFSIIPHSVS